LNRLWDLRDLNLPIDAILFLVHTLILMQQSSLQINYGKSLSNFAVSYFP
jgi:hypothetical protein